MKQTLRFSGLDLIRALAIFSVIGGAFLYEYRVPECGVRWGIDVCAGRGTRFLGASVLHVPMPRLGKGEAAAILSRFFK